MPSLNPNRRRWDKRGIVQHHGTSQVKVQPETEIAMAVKVDPVSALWERVDGATQEAVIAVITPVLAERDQVIGELREELRLERIRSDQADRLHARVDRARERQIAELKQEADAQERHVEYLRGQLASSQSVERLASAIVGAAKEAK